MYNISQAICGTPELLEREFCYTRPEEGRDHIVGNILQCGWLPLGLVVLLQYDGTNTLQRIS
jgi:hypothetical protein